jgi:basic amino acid/polyamine antiporter, APA family
MSTPLSAPLVGSAPRADAGLIRVLGTFGLAASIVNITVGGGIFRLPADVGAALGAAAPIACLVCAVAMGLIVLCFADAGSRVSLTGGPYAYVETAFGPFVGFMAGILLWLIGTFATAAVATVFVASVGAMVPGLGSGAGGAALLIGTFAFFALVNIRGARQGALLNNVMTVAKLLPLLLLAVAGVFAVRADHLRVTSAPAAGALARTSILLIFAFMGVETALVPGGEVRDPARTVPRAILLAMLGVTLLYVVLQVVAQGVLGPTLATAGATPLADAAGLALGGWARALLLAGASISMFGFVGGMSLAVPRALFAFGRDGILPRQLASVHPRFRTPHVAIGVQAVLAGLLAVSSTFAKLAILANLSNLLLYAACCVAAWVLRRRGVQQGGTPFRVPFAGVVPWLACGVIAWLLTAIRPSEWVAVLAALGAAAIFYLLAGRRTPAVAASSVSTSA